MKGDVPKTLKTYNKIKVTGLCRGCMNNFTSEITDKNNWYHYDISGGNDYNDGNRNIDE